MIFQLLLHSKIDRPTGLERVRSAQNRSIYTNVWDEQFTDEKHHVLKACLFKQR